MKQLIALLALVPTFCYADITVDLEAHYIGASFSHAASTTVSDESTNSNTGTVGGGDNTEDLARAGKTAIGGDIPYSMMFDGSSDYITVGAMTGLPTGNSERAIAFWVGPKLFATGADDCLISLANSSTSGERFDIYLEDNAISIGFFGHRLITTTTSLSIGNWYHVIVNVNASASDTTDIEVYINGIEQTMATEAGSAQTMNTATSNVTIMSYTGDLTKTASAAIADVRFYSSVLGTSEINELVALGAPPTNVTFNDITTEAFHVWPMNDSSSPMVDSKGEENLTITGGSSDASYEAVGPGRNWDSALDLNTQWGESARAEIPQVGDFSIHWWFYPEGTSGSRNMISQWNSAGNESIRVDHSNGGDEQVLLYIVNNGASNTFTKNGSAISDFTWHCFTLQKENNVYKVFMDGEEIISATRSGYISGTNIEIGGYDSGSSVSGGRIAGLIVSPGINEHRIYRAGPGATTVRRIVTGN